MRITKQYVNGVTYFTFRRNDGRIRITAFQGRNSRTGKTVKRGWSYPQRSRKAN